MARVLNICETAHGGVGAYFALMARLAERGYDLHFLMPEQDAHFPGLPLQTHTFDKPRRGVTPTRAMVTCSAALIDKLEPDLVFCHSTFSLAALAAHAFRGGDRPMVYCPHGWAASGYPWRSAKRRIASAVEGRLAGLADRVVCVSKHEDALATRLGYRGKRVVIENCVPPPRPDARSDLFHEHDPGALHLLFVGRLDPQKGFDVLAHAMQTTARQDVHLHVVGGAVRGAPRPEISDPRITMHGWIGPDRIDDFYRSADALIVPSRWEGFGLVVPEALRNGTPVLCSDCGPLPDLIQPGKTGAVFSLSVDTVRHVLESLNRETLRAMRPACEQAYLDRFQIGRMIDGLDALFRDLLKKGVRDDH